MKDKSKIPYIEEEGKNKSWHGRKHPDREEYIPQGKNTSWKEREHPGIDLNILTAKQSSCQESSNFIATSIHGLSNNDDFHHILWRF